MFARSLLVVALLASPSFAAAPALPPAKPTVVFQMLPMAKCLADLKALLRQASNGSQDLVKEMESGLQDKLGEKGFEGLDINRPLAGYLTLPADLDKTAVVFVLPITTEKEFLDLLDRLHFTANEAAGKKGLYKLGDFPIAKDPLPTTLRFADGQAYIAMNDEEGANLDPARLLPVDSLVRPDESANLAIRLDAPRLPKATIEGLLKKLNEAARGASFAVDGTTPWGVLQQRFFEKGAKLVSRYAQAILNDGKEVAFRLGYDENKLFFYELALTPKPGSPLARDILARKEPTSPFAGLATDKTALSFNLQLPLFAPELCDIGEAGFGALLPLVESSVNESAKPVMEALFKGLGRTVKAGRGDMMWVMNGPDKDGRYTAVAAFSFDDAATVEKAVREYVKTLPELARKIVAFDADKAGAVGLHKMAFGEALPEKAQQIFGPEGTACAAFGPQGIYIGFGPNALADVKAAVLSRPGPVKVSDFGLAPKRALPLLKVFNPLLRDDFLKDLEIDPDRHTSIQSATVTGGTQLRVRVGGKVFNTQRLLLSNEE